MNLHDIQIVPWCFLTELHMFPIRIKCHSSKQSGRQWNHSTRSGNEHNEHIMDIFFFFYIVSPIVISFQQLDILSNKIITANPNYCNFDVMIFYVWKTVYFWAKAKRNGANWSTAYEHESVFFSPLFLQNESFNYEKQLWHYYSASCRDSMALLKSWKCLHFT